MELMTLHRRSQDHAYAYARRIRAYLEEHQGIAPVQRYGVTGGPHLY